MSQGKFLPAVALFESGQLDLKEFIVDPNLQAKAIHYMAHYGKIKPLRVLLEHHGFEPNEVDVFQQNLAIYASRQGQLDVIRYLHKKVITD